MKGCCKLLGVILLFPLWLHAQTNRALLVAIDTYPSYSGWSRIHATNDIGLWTPVLRKNGYSRKHIQTLANEEATRQGIVSAFGALADACGRGDKVFIHFSCHGQQMVDNNGDEPDGLDEALIPYDAQRRYTRGVYEGENHLRDDELETLLDAIRRKIGPEGNMVVVLDACHSGTGTREMEEFVRGTAYIFAPPGMKPKPDINKDRWKLTLRSDTQMSPLTVFSACSDDERNYEYYSPQEDKYYGSLSFALSNLLKNNRGNLTAKQIAEQLARDMKALFAGKRWTQTPFFESTHEDRILTIGN